MLFGGLSSGASDKVNYVEWQKVTAALNIQSLELHTLQEIWRNEKYSHYERERQRSSSARTETLSQPVDEDRGPRCSLHLTYMAAILDETAAG